MSSSYATPAAQRGQFFAPTECFESPGPGYSPHFSEVWWTVHRGRPENTPGCLQFEAEAPHPVHHPATSGTPLERKHSNIFQAHSETAPPVCGTLQCSCRDRCLSEVPPPKAIVVAVNRNELKKTGVKAKAGVNIHTIPETSIFCNTPAQASRFSSPIFLFLLRVLWVFERTINQDCGQARHDFLPLALIWYMI